MIPQYEPLVDKDYTDAVASQMSSGWYGPGKVTTLFESMIKDTCYSRHDVTVRVVPSGTIALMLAIKALDVPKHFKILFPSYTFLAGANAARFLGYEVELVDVNENTLCMDIEALERKLRLSKDPTQYVVIYVTHNGYSGPDGFEIRNICDNFGISMIEDGCQSLGSPNFSLYGHIATLSFSVPKIVTTGQGGAVVSCSSLANRIDELCDHGGGNWRKTRIHESIGLNARMSDINSALGVAQLSKLPLLLGMRQGVRVMYQSCGISILGEHRYSPWMMLHKTTDALGLAEYLWKHNIQAVQYYTPISWNVPYALVDPATLPNAEKIYESVLYLPSSLSLTIEQVSEISKHILEFNK